MALSSVARKTHKILLIKSLIHYHQPLLPPLLFSITHSFSSQSQPNITQSLISIFTKQPFNPNDTQLTNLAPIINSKIVESVLNGFKSWEKAHVFFNWASKQSHYKHNIYTFNAMASILSRARQYAAMRALAFDVVNSRCIMTPGSLGFFIRCLGSLQLGQEAIVLFDQVAQMGLCAPDSYSYNCLLEALSKSSCVDLVQLRFEEMCRRGFTIDKFTLMPVLQAYGNAGMFGKALSTFNVMYEHGWVDQHVCCSLVVAFSKLDKVDEAFELIERMEDHRSLLNEKTFYVLIHGFVKADRLDKALQLFVKMQKCGFTPGVSLYDVIIGGLCKNNELNEALHLYSQMKQSGIHPDVGILTNLLSSFSDSHEVIHFIQENLEDMDMDGQAITLFLNSFLNALVNCDLIDKAHGLLLEIIGEGNSGDFEVDKLSKGVKGVVHLDSTSFSIVIDGLLKAAKLDMALNLFREMSQMNCKPSVTVYNNIIDGLCNSNRLDESYELLKEMRNSGLEPTHFTYNSLFACLSRREDVAGALNLVREMHAVGHEPWIKNSTMLVKQLCERGRVLEACKFLSNVAEEGLFINIVTFSAALDGLVKIQQLDEALDLFREICARGYQPDVVAHNIIIKGLCKAQRVAEAQDVMLGMVRKGLVPSVITYNLMIDGWCKNGDIDQAMLCLSKMFGEKREPNVITYTTLVHGLCSAGRSDDALLLWNEMERRGCAPNGIAFMALIRGLCECGRPDTALVYFHEMEEKKMKPDTYVYVALISSFLSNDNMSKALDILNKMVMKENFPDPHDKNYVKARDAVLKLSEDASTSSGIKSLIEKGRIPAICLSDTEIGPGPTI